MFSTFTGNSRRPRTVNMSGQAGNPFANTAWTPSLASNATKTVTEAQAERERRHMERQRLRAADIIQRLWRGHKTRHLLADQWRNAFDHAYRNPISDNERVDRLQKTSALLLAFFSSIYAEDIRRACTFADEFSRVPWDSAKASNADGVLQRRLLGVFTKTLSAASQLSDLQHALGSSLKLMIYLISHASNIDKGILKCYYQSLGQLASASSSAQWAGLFIEAITAPLTATSGEIQSSAYEALAYHLLTHSSISLFHDNVALFSERIDQAKLSDIIRTSYPGSAAVSVSREGLFWLLCHFIHLGSHWIISDKLAYLSALFSQLSFLTPEIALLHDVRSGTENSFNEEGSTSVPALPPYVSERIDSLGDPSGIAKLLDDFSERFSKQLGGAFSAVSVFAGYFLTLLKCFPTNADSMRVRLLLGEIPGASGKLSTVKYTWQMMKETSIFRKLTTNSEEPLAVLQRHLRRTSHFASETTEEQEWRVILMFLELYTFVLRLSDDEDFMSGMSTKASSAPSVSSRTRASNLALSDVKSLIAFLKNAAFTLHFKANELPKTTQVVQPTVAFRLDSYLGANEAKTDAMSDGFSTTNADTDLDGLRTLLTTSLRMLYERDSRIHFLDPTDWLMPGRLELGDFVNAVIAEEERRNLEDTESDSEERSQEDALDLDPSSSTQLTLTGQRLTRHARLERLRVQQQIAIRDRKLAEMQPKLEILKHMPFVVPFETRVSIFRRFVELDRHNRLASDPLHHISMMTPGSSKHHGNIRRGQLFEDAYNEFYSLGEGFKDTIHVTFVDQFDSAEAGIDGGGVTKEFLTSVTSEAFGKMTPDLGMFTSNEQGLLFPDPTAADSLCETLRTAGLEENGPEWIQAITDMCKRFEFLGRIVGKCMYEGILVDLAFAGFFLLKWPSAGPKDENTYKGNLNDLREMDESLYKGMLRLKDYPGDISELGFDFTVEDQVSRPGEPVKTITRKLIMDGDGTTVTNDNRLLYISYMARHRLDVQPRLQTKAFLRGLRAMIRPYWLSMFNQSELQRLVGGDSSEIDLRDLRRHTVYSGLYQIGDDGEEHPTIKLFWKVMEGFTDAQRRDVLKYVSSTPRAPLLGFSQLRPLFTIRDGGTDEERLPSASTCVNLFKLPRYTTEGKLREKVLYAVTSGAGFDLS